MSNLPPQDAVDVLIIGAGPSGLAAANRCLSEGVSFAVIEQGPSIDNRSPSKPEELACGVGGAGLYSDGKLSFYPSAHRLWALPGERVLREAYGWLQGLSVDLVDGFPGFPRALEAEELWSPKRSAKTSRKDYASLVLSPEGRAKLLQRLVTPVEHCIFARHTVDAITFKDGVYTVRANAAVGSRSCFIAKRVILCVGRFGTRLIRSFSPSPDMAYRRVEFGVRIEQTGEAFFLRDDQSVDTKLLFVGQDKAVEWRTFCCCRQGSVVETDVCGIRSWSGASTSASEMSNIGFNCRILSARLYDELQDEIERLLDGKVPDFSCGISEFMATESACTYLGPRLDQLLRQGLQLLTTSTDLGGAILRGPCIEGVGFYPKLAPRLESNLPGLFVAGDASGIFRGLLPGLVSGVYAAAHAAHPQANDAGQVVAEAQIKRSPVSGMPLVFTAQSKRFFYCRDAVCEYVLENGGLPVNPFRVFDYFLGDRVNRDLIRQGNNQLIRTCDELWVFGPVADGVLFELFYAAHVGKPVRFFTIGTRRDEIRPLASLDEISFEPEVHAPQQSRRALLDELRVLFENSIVKRQPSLFDYQ